MRLLTKTLLGIAAVGTVAHAQTTIVTTTPAQQIVDAYNLLRGQTNLKLELIGTDSGTRLTRLHAVLYLQLEVDPRTNLLSLARTELDEFEPATSGADVLVRRTVGDGVTLWVYDLKRASYSASVYGFTGAAPANGYVGSDAPRLVTQLYGSTQGPYAYLARLLRELNLGPLNRPEYQAARYITWNPGIAPDLASNHVDPTGTAFLPVIDPLSRTRAYIAGIKPAEISSDFVLYGTNYANPRRIVAFHLVANDPTRAASVINPMWLRSITFTESRSGQVTDWTMTIDNGDSAKPPAGSGAFVPYTSAQIPGWRQIVTPRPYREN